MPIDESLAAIRASLDELHMAREALPHADDPSARLRAGLTLYIDWIYANTPGYLAITRGRIGTEPAVRAVVDQHRFAAADRIIQGIGAPVPTPPAIRATVRAWIGYLDELLLDHLHHRDVPQDTLIELAASSLLAGLGTAAIASSV